MVSWHADLCWMLLCKMKRRRRSEVDCGSGGLKRRVMGIFGKKKSAKALVVPEGCEPVLRCSICTGEQVLCLQRDGSSELEEVMLIRSPGELDEVCRASGLDPESIRKVY